jgi:sarcosine oxidase subunit delta
MRIRCPFCGERDLIEFSYLGDANPQRPDPNISDAQSKFFEAIYVRENPAGSHQELWYHTSGCRSWLQVVRDTRTHEIIDVDFSRKSDA